MVRGAAIALAGFLSLLWLLGLTENWTTWLTWSVGAAAMLALGVAKLVPDDAPVFRAALWPALLGALLLVVGLAAADASWALRWWTMIVGAKFLLVAAGAPMLPWLRAQRSR